MLIFQKGFNFGEDGPGNRLVYHLQGCNMTCLWCSNPEGMSFGGGKEYSIEKIFDECKRSRMLFFSGGGVTFTGGEATVQYKELKTLLALLSKEGIHTAIETNGTHRDLPLLLPYVDYLMMDFKHFDTDIHRKYTGLGNEIIKSNFESNCREKRQQHIRIPLVNGVNTDNPEGFASYFSRFDTENTVFEFLPYHEYGKEKWKTEYKIKNGFVSEEILESFKSRFYRYGLKIITT